MATTKLYANKDGEKAQVAFIRLGTANGSDKVVRIQRGMQVLYDDWPVCTISANAEHTTGIVPATLRYGQPWAAVLITDSGYGIDTVEILMNGIDITENVYEDGVISIPRVTGNVVITVETSSVTDTTMFTKRTTGNGISILNNKALLKGVRGNTMVYHNPVGSSADYTNVGLTIKYSDRTFTISGQSNSNAGFSLQPRITGIVNHVYYVYLKGTHNFYGMTVGNSATLTSPLSPTIAKCINASNFGVYITVKKDVEYSANFEYYLIDLTYLFGKGNEPMNAQGLAAFEKLFPQMVRPYNSSLALNNSMTNYISKRYDAVGVTPVNSTNVEWTDVPVSGAEPTATPVDGIFTIQAKSTGSATLRSRNAVGTAGKVYYWACYVKAPSGKFRFCNYGGEIGRVTINHNEWVRVSRLNTGKLSRCDFQVYGATVGDVAQFKNLIYVSLTDMFGAGNEPTLEVCNTIFDGIPNWQTKDDFDNWNILQTVPLDVTQLTGKLNSGSESEIIFPDGLKSTFALPNITPSYLQKSDSKASYFDIDYIPTGSDVVIKGKIRFNSYISTAANLVWFAASGNGNKFRIIRSATSNNVNLLVQNGSSTYKEFSSIVLANNTYEFELSQSNLKWNGTDYALTVTQGSENTYSLKLLAGINCYFYYFQVYKAGELVVDLIPYRDATQVRLYDRARNRLFALTQASGEGTVASVEPTYSEVPTTPIYDEIKKVDGVWKAFKRVGTQRTTNTANSGRDEYVPYTEDQVYILDDQTIPIELNVVTGGTEEITPTNGATPTTAPAIMEIQYGSIPQNLLGGGLLGGMLGGTNGGSDDEDEEEPINEDDEPDYEEPVNEEESEEPIEEDDTN